MIRPWHIWLVFVIALGVALAALGWVSGTVLRLDWAETEAAARAELESDIRLALWRIDSAVAPLIAQESARPWSVYTAFHPAAAAYTRMLAPIQQGEVLIPSPLLDQASAHIRLHFQFGPDGALTSPQVPTGSMCDIAESGYTAREKIDAAAGRLAEFGRLMKRDRLAAVLGPMDTAPAYARVVPGDRNAAANTESEDVSHGGFDLTRRAQRQNEQLAIQYSANPRQANVDVQSLLNDNEWNARGANAIANCAVFNNDGSNVRLNRPGVQEGLARAVWIDGELVLARWVTANGAPYLQGCWFDWPAMRTWLLGEVRDLLPEGGLEPLAAEADIDPGRRLAGLPVQLIPGREPTVAAAAASPIRTSLLIAWGGVALAAVAVAVLLIGTVSLSERRAAFVSAVTHEMRTPLTTFRFYTEMLSRDMVPDESKRRRYLDTLRAEAERLSHLVGNVLAYARLERNRRASGSDGVSLAALIDRVRGRLQERTRRADMELVIEADNQLNGAQVRADMASVEQILLNLVDNACKYATSGDDRRVHLETSRDGGQVVLKVRDHGPGIGRAEARRLFRPFGKSAHDAADSAPGIGLGLAISRRLARQMGGDLRLKEHSPRGTCFELRLPAA